MTTSRKRRLRSRKQTAALARVLAEFHRDPWKYTAPTKPQTPKAKS